MLSLFILIFEPYFITHTISLNSKNMKVKFLNFLLSKDLQKLRDVAEMDVADFIKLIH